MCFNLYLWEETTDGKIGQISNFAAPAPGKYQRPEICVKAKRCSEILPHKSLCSKTQSKTEVEEREVEA